MIGSEAAGGPSDPAYPSVNGGWRWHRAGDVPSV